MAYLYLRDHTNIDMNMVDMICSYLLPPINYLAISPRILNCQYDYDNYCDWCKNSDSRVTDRYDNVHTDDVCYSCSFFLHRQIESKNDKYFKIRWNKIKYPPLIIEWLENLPFRWILLKENNSMMNFWWKNNTKIRHRLLPDVKLQESAKRMLDNYKKKQRKKKVIY